MTIDKSLKRKNTLTRSRNVLKRGERLLQLKGEEKWKDGQPVLGLPKTRVIKLTVGKKKKVAKKEDDAADKKGGKKK
jgi:small basic protein (TIGR04137 family)